MRAFLLLGFLLAFPAAADDAPRGRLPADVAPVHYALDLTVLPDQARFSGTVAIDVALSRSLNGFWMHGQDLAVDAITVTGADGTRLNTVWQEIPGSGGVARVSLPRALPAGRARIEVRYAAPFNRQLEGLYRADEDGESYAFTQFEAIAARRAFPSFDEPRFKTPFDIALTVRESHVAVANTPELREERRGDGLKRVQFATTKPLPTYLIALAVGPFDVVAWEPIGKSAVRDRVVPLRGIAAKGKGPQLRYALSRTAAIMAALEDYFGVPYPFEKLDLIAALDFAAGAMENAGAIVYREPLLLFEPGAAQAQKRRFLLTHAHEMAHQWFGDLVTPAWWNDIWLNESFATWMEMRVATALEPKGEYGRLILTGAIGAMKNDSWRTARRIAEPVATADDIANAFDSITYEKGGGVLAMFEHYVGPERFRDGVRLYLRRHAWGSATAADFLKALADASGNPAAATAFRSFLTQPGAPVLRTALVCRSDPKVEVRQTRYLQKPQLGPASDPRTWFATTFAGRPLGDQTWGVPLCVAYGAAGGRREACTLATNATASVRVAGSCPAWVMPNADGAGYWRFVLDDAGWKALLGGRAALTETEVLAAIDSLDAAFAAGAMDVGDFLKRLRLLLDRPRGEQMPLAWDVAEAPLPRLVWIAETLADDGVRPEAERLLRDIYGPLARHLGIDATSDWDQRFPVAANLLRPTAFAGAAVHGRDPELRAALLARGRAYLGLGDGRSHPDAVESDMIETMLSVTVEDSGAAVVRRIVELLRQEHNAATRGRLLRALSFAPDPATAAEVRALALDPALRVNEVPLVVFGAVRQPQSRADGWAWFKDNFDAIAARTPPGDRGGLAAIGAPFCTAREREDYRHFFQGKIKSLAGARRIFAATMEQIDTCVGLIAQQRPRIARALTQAAQP